MEKLIFKKFFRDTLNFFLIGTISLSLIVWVIQAVNYLDFVSEDGHSFKVYFFYTLLNFPKIFSRLMLFMFFISIFYTLTRYEEKNELIIFWTNGINKSELLNFIIKLSFVFVIIHLILNIFIVPKTQDTARSFIRSSNIDYFPSLIKSKQFISSVRGLTIFIENKKPGGEIENIFLKDSKNKSNQQIITARKGFLKKDKNYYLVLYEGNIVDINEENSNIISYNKTQLNLSSYQTLSTVDPKIQDQSSKLLFECVISIYKFNKIFDENVLVCNQETVSKAIEELYIRLIVPFYIIVMAIIGSTLILKSEQESNFSKFKMLIFMTGIIFIIISQITSNFIDDLDFVNFLFMSIPFISSILFYFLILRKIKAQI